MNRWKNTLTLSIVMFICMLLVSGATFAYLQWQSSTVQQTSVNVAVSEDINMNIDAATISSNKMYPATDCNEAAGMQGTSYVTIVNNTGVLAAPNFKLKVKIEDKDGNVITGDDATGNAHEYRYYIKYAVAETNGSCSSPLYSGRFNVDAETTSGIGWYDSSLITLEDSDGFPIRSGGANSGVSFNAPAYDTTTHSYKIWAWIDKEYISTNEGTSSSDKLQDATVTVSWSENSTVEQIRRANPGKENAVGAAYAIYSADDTSLRFYRSEEAIVAGSIYNGLTATAVYTGFEDGAYDTQTDVPWSAHNANVTAVVFEDYIYPKYTQFWFSSFSSVTSIDASKLDTSDVTNMTSTFFMCSNLTSLDLSGWNTSNVKSMVGMFYSCSNLTSLNISNWDTSSVTNMSYMFWDSSSLTSLDLNGWNVCNVTNYSDFSNNSNIIQPNWGMSCPTV